MTTSYTKPPLRAIVRREPYRTASHPRGAKDSVICTLSCGHTQGFKGSRVPQHMARCRECYLRGLEVPDADDGTGDTEASASGT